MEKYYLVTWQLGDNDQSYTETPVNIIVSALWMAGDIMAAIKNAIQDQYGVNKNRRILGVFSL